jgi:Uma2 family endonuclease
MSTVAPPRGHIEPAGAPAGGPAQHRCIEPAQRFVLDGITWHQYVAISDALPERAGLRTAFDGARLELMTTSSPHEWSKGLLGRIIRTLTFETELPLHSGGNTTFRREDLERGLEPDECFWIEHARQIDNHRNWDPRVDPPPDLAVEIDVASSSVDREDIYSKLRVPELWRFDGERLRAFRRNDAAEYEPIEYSLAFPFLRVADLLPFLLSDERDENTLMRSSLEWFRQQGHPRR